METQFKRLTSPRFPKTSTRFETLLMTTRRSPSFSGCAEHVTMQAANPTRIRTLRKPFFSRQYSTQAAPTPQNMKRYTVRQELLLRQATNQKKLLALNLQVKTHSRVKQRLTARSRLHEYRGYRDLNMGGIDIRHSRSKSPRNALYLQRKNQTQDIPYKSEATNMKSNRLGVLCREKRAVSYAALNPVPGLHSTTALLEKSLALTRRNPSVLRTLAVRNKKKLNEARSFKRFFSLPKKITNHNLLTKFDSIK